MPIESALPLTILSFVVALYGLYWVIRWGVRDALRDASKRTSNDQQDSSATDDDR